MSLFHSTYHPPFPLNQIIDTIWVAKASSLEMSSTHHAALFTELIFNYGGQFRVEGENVQSFASPSGQYIISGLKTTPFLTSLSGKHLNVGFLLKPNYYGMLLHQFAGASMHVLSEILFEELIVPDIPRFKRVMMAITEFFRPVDIDLEVLMFENQISPGLMRNGALRNFSKSTSITQKSFIARFKKFHAITPGEYLRLKQVNYATDLIRRHPQVSLTQIGLESGFYDQSHFIRVFKKHHGRTPKQFQKDQIHH